MRRGIRPLSLCTVVAGRLDCLRRIADATCRWICDREDRVEWIVLEYEPTAGVEELLKSLSRKYGMGSRLCHVVREVEACVAFEDDGLTRVGSFALARAKNLAHSHGSGIVFVNLDCDNIVGEFEDGILDVLPHRFDEATVLRQEAELRRLKLMAFAPEGRAEKFDGFHGTGGRVAVGRDAFCLLGGYDERFYGHSGEDTDIVWRSRDCEEIAYREIVCEVGHWPTSEEVYAQCWPNRVADQNRNIRLLNCGGRAVPANGGVVCADACVRRFYS